MNIITAIIQRVAAHHSAEARFEVYDDETWCVMLMDGGNETLIHSGKSFSELPALLSSLK